MVKVFKKDVAIKDAFTTGEVINEDKKTFKLHTSDTIFSKKDYYYERAI